ncbi:MAG: hypothetical protein KIT54_09060, partial [Phycisphaeraceae bacterium]|nr:hypothetical protein [Phycisphaeraceae bacterium]
LGQRIVESDGTTNTSLIYDERWRLISRSESGNYTEETLYHHAGLDGMGGASDIDGVILRRTFLATGTPQTEDKRWYVLQNWRQDAAVIISDAGVQRERAFYSPYGRVFGMPAGDLNFDGEFTSTEATTISGWSAGYRAYADINLDGVIDGDDATANTPGALGWDALSRDGSTIGYAGYVQDSSIPTLSHVRHRVYKSDLGRWVQRDPAGYVDGASLYEYAMSSPTAYRDPSGLSVQITFTSEAIQLLNWYMNAGGATYRLSGHMLNTYLQCPNVASEVAKIKTHVDTIGHMALGIAIGSIDCDCNTPLPGAIAMTVRGLQRRVSVLRPSPTIYQHGRTTTIVLDLCYLIGGHFIRYDYTCGINAGCTGFLPGHVYGTYSCGISFRMTDRFSDVASIWQFYADYYRGSLLESKISRIIPRWTQDLMAGSLTRRIDRLAGTPFDIEGVWNDAVGGNYSGYRPWGWCEYQD